MLLAIESSCDESALALFAPEEGIVYESVWSQIATHVTHGGVVPELAVREHLKKFPELMSAFAKAMADQTSAAKPPRGEGRSPSNNPPPPFFSRSSGDKGVAANSPLEGGVGGGQRWVEKIDKIAVTVGPGLVGSLAMGMALGKALSVQFNIPIVGVNHLRAHAFSPFIALHKEDPKNFLANFQSKLPHLGLLVSGGNTLLYEIGVDKELRLLARTVDDAAGEALDKAAKMLGLPYPGGPMIEKLAMSGNPKAYEFPLPFKESPELKFSFSGLKTSLRYRMQAMSAAEVGHEKENLAASFQQAVVEALMLMVRRALRRAAQSPRAEGSRLTQERPASGSEECAAKPQRGEGQSPSNNPPSVAEGAGGWATGYKSIGVCGGVAQNTLLRNSLTKLAEDSGVEFMAAQPKHCGDNAAMIAFAAWIDEGGLREAKSFEPAVGIEG